MWKISTSKPLTTDLFNTQALRCRVPAISDIMLTLLGRNLTLHPRDSLSKVQSVLNTLVAEIKSESLILPSGEVQTGLMKFGGNELSIQVVGGEDPNGAEDTAKLCEDSLSGHTTFFSSIMFSISLNRDCKD